MGEISFHLASRDKFEELNKPNLSLVRDVSTQWNTTYDMLKRMVDVRTLWSVYSAMARTRKLRSPYNNLQVCALMRQDKKSQICPAPVL